jgi:DNA-binding MarR family transcriptional regulator
MFSDNLDSADNTAELIKDILHFDYDLQRNIRAGWPEAWLHINLPLGSTRALLAIENGQASTPRQVAEQLGVGRTTVTGLLDKLEAAALITRQLDPNDRRSFILSLTPKGRDLMHQIDETRQNLLARGLALMDTSALLALRTGLAALHEAMQHSANPNSNDKAAIYK